MTQKQENNILFKDFIDRFHFCKSEYGELKDEYSRSIELYVSPYCNTKCVYCYVKNFRDKIYPNKIGKKEDILNNLKLLLDYFKRENIHIQKYEIFSGEFFFLTYWEEFLEILYQYFKDETETDLLIVPTNSTFLMDDEKTKKIEKWVYDFKMIGIYMSFSHSVDGKYADPISRPFASSKYQYTDEFYDKLFEFSKKYNSGFHPMIDSSTIHIAIKNFEWYIESLANMYDGDYFKAIGNIYLLEVRNPTWDYDQLIYLNKFIRHVIHRVYELYGLDKEFFVENFLFKGRGMNMFSSFVSYIGRGIGCSFQQCLYIRMGDLAIVPCHRTCYPGYEGGKFIVENKNITGIEAINPYFYITSKTFDATSGPVCQDCAINALCNKYCIGCNMEVNGEPYIPVPIVCKMEFVKFTSMIEAFEEIRVMDIILAKMSISTSLKSILRIEQINSLREYIKTKENWL